MKYMAMKGVNKPDPILFPEKQIANNPGNTTKGASLCCMGIDYMGFKSFD